jgi:hypothetical protein
VLSDILFQMDFLCIPRGNLCSIGWYLVKSAGGMEVLIFYAICVSSRMGPTCTLDGKPILSYPILVTVDLALPNPGRTRNEEVD